MANLDIQRLYKALLKEVENQINTEPMDLEKIDLAMHLLSGLDECIEKPVEILKENDKRSTRDAA